MTDNQQRSDEQLIAAYRQASDETTGDDLDARILQAAEQGLASPAEPLQEPTSAPTTTPVSAPVTTPVSLPVRYLRQTRVFGSIAASLVLVVTAGLLYRNIDANAPMAMSPDPRSMASEFTPESIPESSLESNSANEPGVFADMAEETMGASPAAAPAPELAAELKPELNPELKPTFRTMAKRAPSPKARSRSANAVAADEFGEETSGASDDRALERLLSTFQDALDQGDAVQVEQVWEAIREHYPHYELTPQQQQQAQQLLGKDLPAVIDAD